ncbi:MAG: hypothetical protein R3190_05155, partial [Thermoanaerobaculia bacterium]|nr:hypothetical protein [Thermoanaerobaculia bacterium]
GLPEEVDLITVRALQLPMPAWDALISRLSPSGRVLVWAGGADPTLPEGLIRVGEMASPGAARRRILAFGVAD